MSSAQVISDLRIRLLTEQGNRCARCGKPDPCEVVRSSEGHRLICPACFLKLPAVHTRLQTLAPRRGDPVHRYVKWQAYERDGGACRLCGRSLRPAEAEVGLNDRRLIPDLPNVLTVCSACARAGRTVRRSRAAAVPLPLAAAGAVAPPSESAGAPRGVLARRRRLFAESAGRCNLCGTLITQRTARLIRLHPGSVSGRDALILVCPDCRLGAPARLTTPVPLTAEALEQFTSLTGVAASQAPFAAGLVLELGTLLRYRRQGQERLYQYDRLSLLVRDGTLVAVRAEPGWSPLRWPGTRTLRQQLQQHRARPRLDLVTLRLPSDLLQAVQGLVTGTGPGWSLELWLAQRLSQAVEQERALVLR